MAYVNQETKKQLVAAVKAELNKVLKGDQLKVTFAVRNHSTIVATIKQGTIDFGKTYDQVNHYHLASNYHGRALEVLEAIKRGLMTNHYDDSDIMSDYFNCSWYIDINIGCWNKPYQLI
jgi:hypothetical protein